MESSQKPESENDGGGCAISPGVGDASASALLLVLSGIFSFVLIQRRDVK